MSRIRREKQRKRREAEAAADRAACGAVLSSLEAGEYNQAPKMPWVCRTPEFKHQIHRQFMAENPHMRGLIYFMSTPDFSGFTGEREHMTVFYQWAEKQGHLGRSWRVQWASCDPNVNPHNN